MYDRYFKITYLVLISSFLLFICGFSFSGKIANILNYNSSLVFLIMIASSVTFGFVGYIFGLSAIFGRDSKTRSSEAFTFTLCMLMYTCFILMMYDPNIFKTY